MTALADLRAARVDLMADLEATGDAEHRLTLVHDAVVDTGGTLVLPQSDTSWGPVNVELHLLAVSASGVTEEAAIAAWCAAVSRMEIAFQEEEARAA